MDYYNLSEFRDEVEKNIITHFFPNLNITQKNILINYFIKIVYIIAYSFNFDENNNDFLEKIKFNQYRDGKGIFNLLIPYINLETDKYNIYDLNDLYVKQVNNTNVNINEKEPKYEYTNIQYGRCNRKNEIGTEIQFNEKMLEHNYKILVDTIRLSSKRLYVNWLNVLPPTTDFINKIIDKTKKYIDTLKNINNNNTILSLFDDIYNTTNQNIKINKYNLKIRLNGLQEDEIYDCITNCWFYDVKNVKWLIYDVAINKDNNNGNNLSIYPIIVILKDYFKEYFIIENKDYSELNLNHKEAFSKNWKDLLENKNGLNNYTFERIIKSIIIFFNNHYKGKNNLIEKGKYTELFNTNTNFTDEKREEAEEEENINAITINKILKIAKKIPIEDIYTFIADSLEIFDRTFYKNFIYIETNMDGNIKYEIKNVSQYNNDNNKSIPITPKNYYNFGKSFCHYTNSDGIFTEYPKMWKSLNDGQRLEIIRRLCDKSYLSEWFKIKNNIKNVYSEFGSIDASKINKDIGNGIFDNLIKVVVSTLSIKGILSQVSFGYEKSINFDSKKDSIQSQKNYLNKNIFDNKDLINAYYYLTGKKYKDTYTNYKPEKSDNYITTDYFKYLMDGDSKFYLAYGLAWELQINFCHKFLNNRIIYVTGATGVGKSTQIPKLLLYYLLALNYKNMGKVICTQPRRTPTENNAKRIATELGVPIDNKNTDKYTNKYFLQFKHQGQNKSKNVNHPFLKFETDGTLNLEINNPLLMKTITKNKNDNNIKFIPDNIYDIVAIDEAHEHNANMDFILTYMREVINYNNSIKLVIISATMEEDEPRYRRYYRNINDNRMYPLSLDIQRLKLDRINVDRRLDISEPGKTTRFTVKDIYLEEHQTKDPILLIQNIIKKDNQDKNSDILFFNSGQNDIQKNVIKLNQSTPPNVIAIPYYAELKKTQRMIIDNLAIYKDKIKMDKYDDFNLIDPMKGNNNYSKIIIVATNIAEASITINSLKYVIDTGTQKISKYDWINMVEPLYLDNISESSRKQRRGRVGRVGAGIVYYMYEKNKMANNKIKYNISLQNISNQLYSKLYLGPDEKYIFSLSNDPNNYNNIISNKINNLTIVNLYDYTNLSEIIKKLYFIENTFYNYYGDLEQYDYNNDSPLPKYYLSGYDYDTLNDIDGKFYIVHPEELNFERNILGTIVKTISPNITLKNNKIDSIKMNSFWKIFIINGMIDVITTNDNRKYILKKSIFGKDIYDIDTELKIYNFNKTLLYLYSNTYGLEEQGIRFLSLLNSVKNYPDNFISTTIDNKNKKVSNIDNAIKLYGNQKSDICAMLNIINKFHDILDFDFNLNKKNILPMNQINNIVLSDEFKKVLGDNGYDEVKKAVLKNNINSLREKDIIIKIYMFKLYEKILDIKNICEKLYIEPKTIIKYFEKYIELTNNIYNNKMDKDNIGKFNIKYKSIMVSKNVISIYDKFSMVLLKSFPFNLVKKIHRTNFYLSVSNPSYDTIKNIKPIISKQIASTTPNTLVNPIFMSNYLLYINLDIPEENNNSISLLHYISPSILSNFKYTIPSKLNEKNSIEYIKNIEVLENIKYTFNEIQNQFPSK